MKRKTSTSVITIIIALTLGALVALAGSQGGTSMGGVALFAVAVALAFLVQIVVFVPSWLANTEKFFDLTGSVTYIAITVALLFAIPAPDTRTWLLAAMVILWAVRLGSFLFLRILKAGADDRFDEIKASPVRFLQVWVLQGLWVSLTTAAAWIAMTSDAAQRAPFGWIGIVGALIWAIGFLIEIVADAQKSAFKADPKNRGKFIRSGLWSRSRHPNYFGEIMLWVGVLIVAAPVLVGWQWIALLSPLFVALLLTRVSGIPMLEAKAEKKWGGDADYEAYKKSTPVLVLRVTPRSPAQG